MAKSMPAASRSFLIIKIGALGDVCFAWPAVRALKEAFPGARVDWLVGSRDSDLLAGYPELTRLWIVDSEAVFRRRWRELLRQAREWRREMPRYGAMLLLHRNWGHVAWLSTLLQGVHGTPIYRLSRNGAALPGVIPVRVASFSMHESLAIREVVRRVARDLGGSPESGWSWDFSHLPSPSEVLRGIDPPYWVVHTGGGRNTGMSFDLKQWPYWKEWLSGIVDRSSVQWVLVGAPSERDDFPRHSRIVDRIGRTRPSDLLGLIREAEGLVGVDSGPLHLADALGVRTVGLYGPSSDVSWGLIGPNSLALATRPPCSPCYRDDGVIPECPFAQRCLVDLTVDEVTRAVLASADRPPVYRRVKP